MKLIKECVFGFAHIKNNRGSISTLPLSIDQYGTCKEFAMNDNPYDATETLVSVTSALPRMFKVYGSDGVLDPIYLGFESPGSTIPDWEDEFVKAKLCMQTAVNQKEAI